MKQPPIHSASHPSHLAVPSVASSHTYTTAHGSSNGTSQLPGLASMPGSRNSSSGRSSIAAKSFGRQSQILGHRLEKFNRLLSAPVVGVPPAFRVHVCVYVCVCADPCKAEQGFKELNKAGDLTLLA